ncbi:hypothetical protein EMCRGX_G011743 [Ephydatia muelleri]
MLFLLPLISKDLTSQQYPSRAAPKLVYSGAPTAAGSSQGVLSAAGWHQILGGKENLISRPLPHHLTC